MVIYGYRINSIDMKEVWNKITTVQKNLNKIAFKLYHEQLGKEIAFLCDNITLNVLSREDGISIYDSAVQILNQRIDASQRARSNTLYNYNVFAHIIPYKEYTYIKIVSANQKLLKAFQIFEEYSLSEMECKDPKNKKKIIWDEICSICTKKEPFSINLSISNIDPKKECIKYPSISERAEIIARYTKLYEGRTDYQLQSCSAPTEPAEIQDFIISAPEKPEKMYQLLVSYLKNCREDEWGIVDLTQEILEENKDKLLMWGAAKAIHHNFYGGLLYHTLSMVQEAYVTQKANKRLNNELLICGTILHDIGKLRELTTDEIGVSDYTIEGRLIGHIVLADEMILEKVFLAKQEGHPYPSEKVSMLRHMILSHHGTTEWGSPVAPAILEAEVLHQIDYMDSRLIQYTDAYNKLEAGEMSERIYGLGSSVVRPGFYKNS